jgi:hypothetical protein
MILSDKRILEEMEAGNIVIEPYRPHCLGTNSYDVHLSKHLAVYTEPTLDARAHNQIRHLGNSGRGLPVAARRALPWRYRGIYRNACARAISGG